MNIRTCFKTVLSATVLLLTAACGGSSAGPPPVTIVVAVSGLATNTTVTLQNNGGDALPVAMDGSASFRTPVARGASYMVTVSTQPAGQLCTVSDGSGIAANAAVINVSVECIPVRYAYVANYASNTIAAFAINENTGVLTPIQGPIAVAAEEEPDVIVLSPDGKSIYLTYHCDPLTVCEKEAMLASEYSINANDGTLTHLREIGLESRGPRALVIDPANRFAYFLDDGDIYGNPLSNISVANIDPTVVGPTQIPGNPFPISNLASSLAIRPDGRFLYVGDAGISVYAVDPATGALTIVSNSPASTPFSYAIAIDAQGKFAYVNDAVNLISAYAIDPITGLLTAVSMNPQANNAPGPASVALTRDGKFVYVVLRYGQAIWGYSIDSGTGALTAVPGSPFARADGIAAFAIDPSGKFAFVINSNGDTITSYSIDSSGILSPIAGAVAQSAPGLVVMTIR